MRSREITLQQERCIRKAAWDFAKTKRKENIYKLKKEDKATLYSPDEARATPAPTSTAPDEREFVIDSGASTHILTKRDLSSKQMETLRRSRTPPVVLTANGKCKQARKRICSRSWPLRDFAITRGYASSSIGRKALRRKRMFT